MTESDISSLDLAGIARRSVTEALARDELPGPSIIPPHPEGVVAATFVTIRKDGKLRGCMGSTVARRPLLEEVQSQARSAAFRDPRFPPISIDELEMLRFEVAVLAEPKLIEVKNFEEACLKVRPGLDGVIVRTGVGGALFLPQVWEDAQSAGDFLDLLWKKAGLPNRYFESDVELRTFSVQNFEEPA